jgi:hypothetical protein
MKFSHGYYVKAAKESDLRTSDIAALAGVSTARVSDFLNSRRLNAQAEEKIAGAILALHDIQSVIFPAKFDVSSPEKVAAAQALIAVYREKKEAEAQVTAKGVSHVEA